MQNRYRFLKYSWWRFKFDCYRINRLILITEKKIVSREAKKNESTRIQNILLSKVDVNALGNQGTMPSVTHEDKEVTR